MPPQAEKGDYTWNLDRKWAKGADSSSLVRTSASWSFEEMNQTWIFFLATRSQTKWQSTSTCSVRAWKIGFTNRNVAPKLSHHKVVIGGEGRWSSDSNEQSYRILAVSSAKALYLASVEDLTTVRCFLNFQETKVLLRYTK